MTTNTPPKITAKSGAALVAACAVCCAPLIAPLLMAAFAVGGAGLVIADELWCALAVAAAFAAYAFYRRQMPKGRPASGCTCAADEGRSTGDACLFPETKA